MFREEWPLMMFTLFTQLAVGTFIILFLIRYLLDKHGNKALAAQLTNQGFLLVWPVMGIALILSIFHLGSPGIAFRAISNLGSSWLSREILFAGLFFALTVVSWYLYKKGQGGHMIGLITAIVGLIAVYSMSSIYAAAVKPAWSNLNTFICYYGVTFTFGPLAAIALVTRAMKENADQQVHVLLKKMSYISLIAILIQLVYLPIYLTSLSQGGTTAVASLQLLSDSYSFQMFLHWILTVVGSILCIYTLVKKNPIKAQSLLYVAFLCVIVGEFIGRYVFYASGISIMIG
ncbi:dimethyl sulfoxide reductase anchor subunit family protein [Rubeoparvulum massiliense]|uniref:dimethyl sulfoxide reductase anchor subunit family protein n=1 Tax=Rubeoparvulum massiliense TaxID=1631346 RepID=UPI00065E96F4|nr:DmsC/YnfH family molybdoenzyme membrane anchor subunit [Rubeoparvulum massiliense]